MCSLYTSIFSNLFQILVLCYLTLKCFQISNMLYISTYKLCVLALVFKNKKVKISKATPWFLKHDKGVIFFFPGAGVNVAGISQNFSLVPSQILNTAIASTVVYAPERQSSAFFQTCNWNNPGSTFEGKHGLHTRGHFTEPQMKTATSLYIFFKQSQPAMPNYLLPKAFG